MAMISDTGEPLRDLMFPQRQPTPVKRDGKTSSTSQEDSSQNQDENDAVQNGNVSSGPPPCTLKHSSDPIIAAHVTSLRLLFSAWHTHFLTTGYMNDQTMDKLDRGILRKTLTLTVRDPRARDAIGSSLPVWTDILDLLKTAVASLQSRSYATLTQEYAADGTPIDPDGPVRYDCPSAHSISQNYPTLLRDLARLNNILCIARNILTAGASVQNLAAELGIDRQVLCLVNMCVKTTARGYDGDGQQAGEEERWQAVVNEFKKLLITCLQFLSNMVTLNERLKLMLWVELFDAGNESNTAGFVDAACGLRPGYSDEGVYTGEDGWPYAPMGRLIMKMEGNLEGARAFQEEHRQIRQRSWEEAQAGEEEDELESEEEEEEESDREQGEGKGAGGVDESSMARAPTPERAKSRTSVRRQSFRKTKKSAARLPTAYFLWLFEQYEQCREEFMRDQRKEPAPADVIEKVTATWDSMSAEGKASFEQDRAKKLTQLQYEIRNGQQSVMEVLRKHGLKPSMDDAFVSRLAEIMMESKDLDESRGELAPLAYREPPPNTKGHGFHATLFDEMAPPDRTFGSMETAEAGKIRLEDGKRGIMKKLEDGAMFNPPKTELPTQDASTAIMPQDHVSPTSPVPSDPSEHLSDEEQDGDPDKLSPDEEAELEYSEADDVESSEAEEEDYDRIPGEEGRGLLTDIPLILGPNEIEVLPMIIMSGIVAEYAQVKHREAESTPDQLQAFLNMYSARCQLLLTQDNGRNLLRELLIFVAAWDLREEELYFKFMVKIMESILLHGLMPFAYEAFKESKDIISPAQAVIMKMLTKIFHSRIAFISSTKPTRPSGCVPHPATGWGIEATSVRRGGGPEDEKNSAQNGGEHTPTAAFTNNINWQDLPSFKGSQVQFTLPENLDPTRAIVSTLFSEFRTYIIPQICALIFLQGQIRAGAATIEDFPLNLWDMERMYEGVYQYLEFFAILTDHDEWKELMAGWEVVAELVTLLRELEYGISKGQPDFGQARLREVKAPKPPVQESLENDESQAAHEQLVEHLKKESEKAQKELAHMKAASGRSAAPASAQLSNKAPVSVERPYSPLPQPPTNAPNGHAAANTGNSSPLPQAAPATREGPVHEEPAEFEWRNLKKLCVLVLSSLVWKNATLQQQVLSHGGVEVLLHCCQRDDHNPYIREHAIMCLRFLVEGNTEIRARVKFLSDVYITRWSWEAGELERPDFFMGHDGSRYIPVVELDPAEHPDPVIRAAAATEDPIHVPYEVLDDHGYETYMGSDGQVGLRRKGVTKRRKSFFSATRGGRRRESRTRGRRSLRGSFHDARQYADDAHPAGGEAARYLDDLYGEADEGGEVQYNALGKPVEFHIDSEGSETDSMDEWEVDWARLPKSLQPGRGVQGDGGAVQGTLEDGASKGKGKMVNGSAGANGTAAAHANAEAEKDAEKETALAKPRTAADLPEWVARITRDLPHKRAQREREMALREGRAV